MKVLFATPCPPIPFGGGGSRMFYLIKYLSKLGIEIDLLTIVDKENINDLPKIKDFCQNIYYIKEQISKFNKIKKLLLLKSYDYYNEFKEKLYNILNNRYDLIQVEKFQIAEYFIDIKNIPIIIDLWASGLKGPIYEFMYEKNIFKKAINLTRLVRYNISDYKYYSIFNNFFVVSNEAKEYIIEKYSNKKVFIVPMGMEIYENNEYKESDENILIFTGDMSFIQNIDTVKYFVNKIYPKIKKEIKDIKFYVVGGYPTKEIINFGKKDKSIIVTGYVDDIKEYLYNSKVYVAPIRIGAGMRNKIVEAMGCKKPIVATKNAMEGINANDGEHIFLADEPNKFADCVIKLLKDSNLRKAISENAYNLVKEKYNWENIAKKVISYYNEISKIYH